MTIQPPMPKIITIFCVRAKILMPKTTNRKPTMLKAVARKNVIQALLTTQSAALVQPR